MIALRLGLMTLIAAAAFAQGPVPYPWWDSPVARDLGLTEEQTKQIRATVDESRPRLEQLRSEVQGAESELRTALNDPQVDTRKAEAAIDKVVAARSELTRSVARMSLKLRLLLTPAQWEELQKRSQRPGFGPRGNRGMPGAGRRFPPPSGF